MESVVNSFKAMPARTDPELWLGTILARGREALLDENPNPAILWIFSSEGFASWVRHVDRRLTFELNDHVMTRAFMTRAYAMLLQRRMLDMRTPVGPWLRKTDAPTQRAFFEALSPGPIARSIRWMLDGITMVSPNWLQSARAWRQVEQLESRARWLEIAHHWSEWTLLLTDELIAEIGPQSRSWLKAAMQSFGREIGSLFVDLYRMPLTRKTGQEIEHMADKVFQIDPGRKRWTVIHAEIIHHFGIGLSYAASDSKSGAEQTFAANDKRWSTWEAPTSLKGYGSHIERMTKLAAEKNPLEGFIGAGSLFWQCSRESVVLLGGGRAALMQLAHPAVAHAIRDHSVVHTDMVGRFIRTMKSAYGVVFDSVEDVMAISNRVYEIHKKISGQLDDVPGQPASHYHALDPEAVFWVGATLLDTTILIYDTMVRPLALKEKDRLVREIGPFWVAFGLPRETCPTSWRDLQSYVVRRTESLAPLVGDSAREQAARLFAPHPALTQPAFDQMRLITAQLLPDSLRKAFGMELNARDRMLARTWLFLAERMRPSLPEALRFVPPYHAARWRLWRGK